MGINYIFQMIRTNEMNKKFKRKTAYGLAYLIVIMLFLSEISRLLLLLYIFSVLIYSYFESFTFKKKDKLESEVESLSKIEEKNKSKKSLL
jgi:Ca2+/Na+ antiporter